MHVSGLPCGIPCLGDSKVLQLIFTWYAMHVELVQSMKSTPGRCLSISGITVTAKRMGSSCGLLQTTSDANRYNQRLGYHVVPLPLFAPEDGLTSCCYSSAFSLQQTDLIIGRMDDLRTRPSTSDARSPCYIESAEGQLQLMFCTNCVRHFWVPKI